MSSFIQYANIPSAIIADGLLIVPLWSVQTMNLTAAYHQPSIGNTAERAAIGVHDDSITLTGTLLGEERYAWKLALETLAEASQRGTALASVSGGAVGGLVLVTSMTIRTDIYISNLTFTANAGRRDALDTTISMVHLPRPGGLAKLLDIAAIGIGALADFGGN